jgi:hypothetical protein
MQQKKHSAAQLTQRHAMPQKTVITRHTGRGLTNPRGHRTTHHPPKAYTATDDGPNIDFFAAILTRDSKYTDSWGRGRVRAQATLATL